MQKALTILKYLSFITLILSGVFFFISSDFATFTFLIFVWFCSLYTIFQIFHHKRNVLWGSISLGISSGYILFLLLQLFFSSSNTPLISLVFNLLFAFTVTTSVYNLLVLAPNASPWKRGLRNTAFVTITLTLILYATANISAISGIPDFYASLDYSPINLMVFILGFLAIKTSIFTWLSLKYPRPYLLSVLMSIIFIVFLASLTQLQHITLEMKPQETTPQCPPGKVYAQPPCSCESQCISKEKAYAPYECAIKCLPLKARSISQKPLLNTDFLRRFPISFKASTFSRYEFLSVF